MDMRQSKWLFLFFPLFFSNQVLAKVPIHLFIGLSGGYGQNSDAYATTGTDGVIRFAFGSILHINSSFVIGDQIGFHRLEAVLCRYCLTPKPRLIFYCSEDMSSMNLCFFKQRAGPFLLIQLLRARMFKHKTLYCQRYKQESVLMLINVVE